MDFESLDPRMRPAALVGMFLQKWAFMEAELMRAIREAFGLNLVSASIIKANTQLRDKVHILRTILPITTLMSEGERKRWDKLLLEIAGYSTIRNMMAHDMFYMTDDNQAVSFFVIKAKGDFDVPTVTWDIAAFESAYDKLDSYQEQLSKLRPIIKTGREYFQAIAQPPAPSPTAGIWSLGLLGSLFPPPQENPGSDQPSDRPSPQTEPKPQE